jgi:hypothetical protein
MLKNEPEVGGIVHAFVISAMIGNALLFQGALRVA